MVSMKMDTALLVQVESSTVVSMKMNTAWQVQVAGSTVSDFGCGRCPFQLGFGFFGAQYGLGLQLGLKLGLDLGGCP